MVDEGKKLSPKLATGLSQSCQSDLRLYYFPDIAVDDRDNFRACLPLEDKFQRTRYDPNGALCTSSTAASHGNGNRREAESFTGEGCQVSVYRKGFSDGLEKGLADGEKAGFASAAKKIEPVLSAFKEALLQLENLRQETYQRIEMQVVDLALAISKKIICREVEMNREVVVGVAKEALAKIEDPARIRIKLSPSDLRFIEEAKYQLSDLIPQIDNATLIAEDGIQSGGCVIETNSGEVDARIEAQLQAVEETFRKALKKPVKPV